MVVEYVVKLLALKNEDGTQKLFNRNIGIGKKHTLNFFMSPRPIKVGDIIFLLFFFLLLLLASFGFQLAGFLCLSVHTCPGILCLSVHIGFFGGVRILTSFGINSKLIQLFPN